MIDQSTTISEQLTLWTRRDLESFGKLVVIPIENSFLYVVALYFRAEGTNFPPLKRFIVATGDKVVMQPTLDGAVSALFGSQETPPSGTLPAVAVPHAETRTAKVPLQLAASQKAIDSLKLLLNEGSSGKQ